MDASECKRVGAFGDGLLEHPRQWLGGQLSRASVSPDLCSLPPTEWWAGQSCPVRALRRRRSRARHRRGWRYDPAGPRMARPPPESRRAH